jgi:Uma2 family endonuclease
MEDEVKEPEPKYSYISPEEYLAMERASGYKHQYYNGEILAMSGASLAHNDVFHNVYGKLVPFLKGKDCKPYGSDLRIHILKEHLYTYPGISIICGKPMPADDFKDNITNPTVIIEILSPSTKDYDKGTKFDLYKSIQTLQEYILIDSAAVHVQIHTRNDNQTWTSRDLKEYDQSFTISSIDFTMSLRETYQDVNFY